MSLSVSSRKRREASYRKPLCNGRRYGFPGTGITGQTSVPFQANERKNPDTKKHRSDIQKSDTNSVDSYVRYLTIRENIFAFTKTVARFDGHSPPVDSSSPDVLLELWMTHKLFQKFPGVKKISGTNRRGSAQKILWVCANGLSPKC